QANLLYPAARAEEIGENDAVDEKDANGCKQPHVKMNIVNGVQNVLCRIPPERKNSKKATGHQPQGVDGRQGNEDAYHAPLDRTVLKSPCAGPSYSDFGRRQGRRLRLLAAWHCPIPPLHILQFLPILPAKGERLARRIKAPAPTYHKNMFMKNLVCRG